MTQEPGVVVKHLGNSYSKINRARLRVFKRNKRLSVLAEPDDTSAWLCVDSGASTHVTSKRSIFVVYHPHVGSESHVEDAGGTNHTIKGRGDILWKTKDVDGKDVTFTVTGVDHCPSIIEGTFLNSTDLRMSQGWTCSGNRHGMR